MGMDSLQVNHRWLGIAILVSIVVHALSILTFGPFKHNTSNELRDPLRISLKKYLPLNQPEEKSVVEQTIMKPELTKSVETGLKSEQTISEVLPKDQVPEQEKKTINYGTMITSGKSLVAIDTSESKYHFPDTAYSDTGELTKIFRQSFGLIRGSSNKSALRIANAQREKLVSILSSTSLDDATRSLLESELNYLSSEIRYQDCGGNLESGTCAGEVDILKLLADIKKIISKIDP